MRVIITPDELTVAKTAYSIVRDRLNLNRINVLGLPTGSSPLKLYKEIADGFRRGELDFSGVHTFNLDEYLGLPDDHDQSYRRFMDDNLFQFINIDPANVHFLYGLPDNVEDECEAYEAEMKYLGGIKLQILGIGRDGHIGFNEPGSSLESRTRLVTIAQETIEDNARFFKHSEDVPRWALSMGVGTIMDADEILLIASGEKKAEAIANAIEGAVSAYCPASALQLHPNTTFIIDEAAAAKLKRANYYKNAEKIAPFIETYLVKAKRKFQTNETN